MAKLTDKFFNRIIEGPLELGDNEVVKGNLILEPSAEAKLFENIVDKYGHARFIEGDITFENITGVSKVFGKWSLSGSHLMIVACPKIDNTTVIGNVIVAYLDDIPQWIKDKIIPIASSLVANFSVTCFNATASSTQSLPVYLRKTDEHFYISMGGFTASDDRYTRIVFDLLIDNEEAE